MESSAIDYTSQANFISHHSEAKSYRDYRAHERPLKIVVDNPLSPNNPSYSKIEMRGHKARKLHRRRDNSNPESINQNNDANNVGFQSLRKVI